MEDYDSSKYESYLKGCRIISKGDLLSDADFHKQSLNPPDPMFFPAKTDKGADVLCVRLDGYAIVPRAHYEELVAKSAIAA